MDVDRVLEEIDAAVKALPSWRDATSVNERDRRLAETRRLEALAADLHTTR